MKRVLIALVVVILIGVAVVVGASFLLGGSERVPSKVVLEIDFESAMVEYLPVDPVAQMFGEQTPQMLDVVSALDRAAEDDRVVGLMARVGNPPLGYAQLQELRGALIRFRRSSKPTVAWSETFGEVSPGNGGYYLASAFDRVLLQPSGDVNLTGMILESLFLRGAFEKIGAEPQMDHRHEYKNAMNMFTETGFTDAHRQAMEELMHSIYDQMVEGIAEGRGLEPDGVRQRVDEGPYLGAEAVEAGLVDALAYRDQAWDTLAELVGDDDFERRYLASYAESAPAKGGGHTIALVHGVGNIVRGPSQFNPLDGSQAMGSDTVAAAIREAVDDRKVEAILFRIDCPGGSYVASDTVWREVARAREAGKPVIASFGNVAASGGYFVAMGADRIVAQEATITGSIGVLGGKILSRDTWSKLGISWDAVQVGENADMWTGLAPYDEGEWERFQAWLDRVYEDFTQKVAEGRGLPIERVREIAKGRVWTGRQALEIGLVDAVGGYETALAEVRIALGLADDARLRLVAYPDPGTAWDRLFADPPANSGPTRAMVRMFEELRPAVTLARRTGLLAPDAPQVLAYPEDLVPRP